MLSNKWKSTIVIGIIVSTLVAVTVEKIDHAHKLELLEQERVKKAEELKQAIERQRQEQIRLSKEREHRFDEQIKLAKEKQRELEAKPEPEAQKPIEIAPPSQATVTIPPNQISPVTSSKPSFDCSRARSRSEIIICSDAELARLDVELSMLYRQALSLASDKAAFKKTNVDEWKRREATCFDRDCLRAWYVNRREQLRGVIAGQVPIN